MKAWLDIFADTVDAQGNPAITTGRDSLITSILSAGYVLLEPPSERRLILGASCSTFVGALLAYPVGDRSALFFLSRPSAWTEFCAQSVADLVFAHSWLFSVSEVRDFVDLRGGSRADRYLQSHFKRAERQ